ncbi:hypothetical protein [Gloeobacter morelensis]|uniref:hypothetical protein n=1 Tax=Gloeobacter morelensis TaxID=2907343 RepID=UPI001E3C9584|nr:hypothetical protein [Gloeobacter morelensis]UFP97300.1 hypothetical protein ISF26_24550 [Gloeobacter morelensis MG652769]
MQTEQSHLAARVELALSRNETGEWSFDWRAVGLAAAGGVCGALLTVGLLQLVPPKMSNLQNNYLHQIWERSTWTMTKLERLEKRR